MSGSMMLLANPTAGKGGARAALGEVLEVFCRSGWAPTVYMTQSRGDATRLTREHAGAHSLLVCLGGDGTLSETVAGMVQMDKAPPLGYIPLGTANDVANTLGLSKIPSRAAAAITCGRPMPLDVGCMNGSEFFTYIAAFGAFTDVSYETRQESKHALGLLAYLLEGLARLPKLSSTHAVVEWDDGVVEDDFIFGGVTNSTSIAGMVKIDNSLVALGDGLFEVILVRNPRNLMDMNALVGDVISKNYQTPHVTVLHSHSIRVRCDKPVKWTRDGENGGVHTEVTLENLHRAVEIVL